MISPTRSNLLFVLAGALAVCAALLLKSSVYGDLRLSVGHADTPSYIDGSRAPLFSWKMFAGGRLFTTNLLYKLANDESRCPLTAVSNPALGTESRRALQPCFDRVVLVQNALSAFAWVLAAWLLSRRLRQPIFRAVSAVLILAFGFTPQIAEWDYTLGPESLTLSLFVIAFAILFETAFRVADNRSQISTRSTRALIVVWAVVFFLWVFVRDVHLYAVPVAFALIGSLLLDRGFQKEKILAALLLLLAVMFILGSKSAQDSLRATHYPLEHAFDAYIFPYEARVDYMRRLGMPERDAPEFQTWFDANATRVYGLFLLTHPRFVATTLWSDMFYLSSDFVQPYFKTDDVLARETLLKIGEFLHPQSLAVYLLDVLLLLGFYVSAAQQRRPGPLAWAWLATWFLLCAAITLFPTFFGDTVGTRRHVFPSVELFRLFIWAFLITYLDRSGDADTTANTAESGAAA